MSRFHLWDNWRDYDEEDELFMERRQYKMVQRIDIDGWDDNDIFCRFRLTKPTVVYVLNIIQPYLQHGDEKSRYIRPIAQLLIALRFYALGTMQLSIADFGGVCQASVSNILKIVTTAICAQASQFIKMPRTDDELSAASVEFYHLARFPRTIGAIDCTHVKIQSPGGPEAENYRNRKGWFSLNVQTVCSANLKVLNIVARWPGASHDQTIFNNSKLKMELELGHFRNFIIVGDSGYRNTSYLATLFLQCQTEIEEFYNESQTRTRNVVERSYGVLKRRFPVLALGMRVKIENAQRIIVACAVLHNIAIDENKSVPPDVLDGFSDTLASMDIPPAPDTGSPQISSRDNIRDRLVADYFSRLQQIENRNSANANI